MAMESHPVQVIYWDYDCSQAPEVHEFTNDLREVRKAVAKMQAKGGGDYPEAVSPAFKAVSELSYREHASKLCVWVTDAPPHGVLVQHQGDTYPDGDPSGVDALEPVHAMAARGIKLFTLFSGRSRYWAKIYACVRACVECALWSVCPQKSLGSFFFAILFSLCAAAICLRNTCWRSHASPMVE